MSQRQCRAGSRQEIDYTVRMPILVLPPLAAPTVVEGAASEYALRGEIGKQVPAQISSSRLTTGRSFGQPSALKSPSSDGRMRRLPESRTSVGGRLRLSVGAQGSGWRVFVHAVIRVRCRAKYVPATRLLRENDCTNELLGCRGGGWRTPAGFTVREEQLAMDNCVATGHCQSSRPDRQAERGVGKDVCVSRAGLAGRQKNIVISTGTRSLQDQVSSRLPMITGYWDDRCAFLAQGPCQLPGAHRLEVMMSQGTTPRVSCELASKLAQSEYWPIETRRAT